MTASKPCSPRSRPAAGCSGSRWRSRWTPLSGSPFEQVGIEGERFVLKHTGRDIDWIMRALGDGRDGAPWALILWREGLLDRLPPEIDHAIVGMAHDPRRGRLSILMHDVGATLVPPGDLPLPLDQHRRFLAHMAATHAAFWGFEDTSGCSHRAPATPASPRRPGVPSRPPVAATWCPRSWSPSGPGSPRSRRRRTRWPWRWPSIRRR